MQDNPFRPLSGSAPIVWAGREFILSEIDEVVQDGENSPYRTALFVGHRGMGKSALLTYAELTAESIGWICEHCLADNDLLQSVLVQAKFSFICSYADTSSFVDSAFSSTIMEPEHPEASSEAICFEAQLAELASYLKVHDRGLLITVDEITAYVSELETLVHTVQKLQAKGYKIALYMSGLPEHINSLLNGSSTSYLRRSMKYYTSFVEDVEVEKTLQQTAKAAGKSFSQDALAKATEAIGGYPYLIQFVGYWCWVCSQEARVIDTDMVDAALKIAIPEYEKNVLEQALSSLSEKDILVLKALSAGAMTQCELAETLGLSRGYLAVYKKRLLDKGLIEQGASKRLEIRLPHLARFVEDFEL